MPNQPKTPGHTIRVPDDEWIPAKDKAANEGETMTDVIRRALRRYVLGPLIVACFVGGGWLAAGYHQTPSQVAPDNRTTVWKPIGPQHPQPALPTKESPIMEGI